MPEMLKSIAGGGHAMTTSRLQDNMYLLDELAKMLLDQVAVR